MTLVGVGTAGARGGNAVLNVVHGIPGVDVNVCVNGAAAIPDFKPGDVAAGVELPAGSYDVKIVAAADTCDDAAILEASGVALKAGKNYTAVANLNANGDPNIKLFTNKVAPVKVGKARLTVRHTAAAPAVNVWANGSVLIGGNDFVWGESATVAVPKGSYRVKVTLPGQTAPVIGPATLKLKTGFAYQVYAWGNGTDGYSVAVVATKVGGVPDVVDEGETGFLVRPHDTHALAERLEILAGDPVRRRAMGDLGRARMLERYAVERLVDDVDALYRELLATTSATTRR